MGNLLEVSSVSFCGKTLDERYYHLFLTLNGWKFFEI